MPRLTILKNNHDYLSLLGRLDPEGDPQTRGIYVLSNVSFDEGAPESVRLNIAEPNSSYRRAHESQSVRFPAGQPPFEIHGPALLLSSSELHRFQCNFGVVSEKLGVDAIGSIATNDPINETLLVNFQKVSPQIAGIDRILSSLILDGDLYKAYLDHPRLLELIQDGQLDEQGHQLLQHVTEPQLSNSGRYGSRRFAKP